MRSSASKVALGCAIFGIAFGLANAQQAPIQLRGGGMQGQRSNPTWRIGPDGIAHFANVDPGSLIDGVRADSLISRYNAALSSGDIGKTLVGYDAFGRISGPMAPNALYSNIVTAATVTTPGSYAPSDLPVTLTVAGNALGQTAQIVPNGYTVTSAAIVAAGNNCPAASVYTLASTGTKVIVSDGNGLAGAVVTVSVGGSAATEADVPANPVSLTSSVTGCTPPQFTLGWGLADVTIPVSGWGYTTAPVVSAPASTLPNGTPASVVAQIQTSAVNLADKTIAASMRGQPGGVAGLDNNKNVTADLLPGKAIMGADAFGAYLSDSFAGGYDPQRGYEVDLLGGNQKYLDGTFKPRQVLQEADPYGPYSAGCGYALNMLGSIYTPQSPVSEAPPTAGAGSVVGVGGFDTVAHCILFGNQPARLVLPVASYTATSIVLSSPLTASQAAQIHPNMYVTTNSPNTALSLTNVSGELPKKNLYAAFVSRAPAAGDTSISVYAWDVPAYGTGASGQVPQTTTLDTVWSKYTSPVVFFGGGAAGSAFASNWYATVDARNLIPSATNKSMIHQITMIEMDGPNVVNGTAPDNSLNYQGITMNASNQPAALTKNSVEIFLGGVVNHHLQFDGGVGNWLIDGDNIFVPSLKQQQLTTVNPTQSYQIWQMPVGVGTKNQFQMVLWNDSGNPTAPDGWERVVTHFGPTVDGAIPADGDPGGSKQGDIEWNAGADYGSVSLCAYAATCSFKVSGSGSIIASKAATFSDVLNVVKGIFAVDSTGANLAQFYPTSAGDWIVGTSVAKGGNIKGVTGYYGISANLTGELNAVSVVASSGTFNGDVGIMAGHKLNMQPSTVSNGLVPASCAPSSYSLATCSNIAASIALKASGDLQSTGGTSSSGMTDGNISGLHADGHGNWSTTTDTTGGGAFGEAAYTLTDLPTTNELDGNHLWCSDCILNGVTGVEAYWHAAASKWTDSQNNVLSN